MEEDGEHFMVRVGSPASNESDLPGSAAVLDEAVQQAKPGTLMLTPLALALIMVEATDLIFAVDSIPAIFAITADPFLVFTSNVFAILGLRSLYFALAEMIGMFRYLKVSLALVLTWLESRCWRSRGSRRCSGRTSTSTCLAWCSWFWPWALRRPGSLDEKPGLNET
jgi:hypothetical protein